MEKKNVNLKMIAAEVGVSVNTVSRALRDMDDISQETKEKVRQKAVELGYMPSLLSQHVKTGEKLAVAILIPSFRNLYFVSLTNHLINLFKSKSEYNLLLLHNLYDADVDVIKQCVLQRIDLLIVHSGISEEAMVFAKLNGIAIVLIDGRGDTCDVDCINVDTKTGAILAARYLFGIHNNRKFLYVGIDNPISDNRFNIYKQELEVMGAEDIVFLTYNSEEVETLYNYIIKGYRSVFFFNDALAYSALKHLDEMLVDTRKLFPDLHIVGFDGLCMEYSGMKQITTIKIDYLKFAEEVYAIVKSRLDKPKEPYKNAIISVSLHQRRRKE